MVDYAALMMFIPTFFLISVSPGLCMTLAMTMGMTLGLRKTFWMMLGELSGVALVGVCAVVGVATMMLKYPLAFTVFKYVGGLYLGYTGIQMWRSKGKMAVDQFNPVSQERSRRSIAMQGFITAIANPKGWAFMIAFLPPFINQTLPVAPQLVMLLAIVLVIEFFCLILYASSGRQLGRLLMRNNNVGLLNKITGSLMIGVGVWLAAT